MEILLLIVLGGLAGWVASIIMKTNDSMGIIGNILIGIAGSFIGTWAFHLFNATGVTGFNFTSFLVALIGSVALLAMFKLIDPK